MQSKATSTRLLAVLILIIIAICAQPMRVQASVDITALTATCNSLTVSGWSDQPYIGVTVSAPRTAQSNSGSVVNTSYQPVLENVFNTTLNFPEQASGTRLTVQIHGTLHPTSNSIISSTIERSVFCSGTNNHVLSSNSVSTISPEYLAQAVSGDGLLGSYYNDINFTNLVLTRVDPIINFNWLLGSPHPVVASNYFGIRWTGYILPRYSEVYTLTMRSDDGVRVWIDDQLIVNRWEEWSTRDYSGDASLTQNVLHKIKIEYHELGGYADAVFLWRSQSQPLEVVPTSQMYSTFVNVATSTPFSSPMPTSSPTSTTSPTPTSSPTPIPPGEPDFNNSVVDVSPDPGAANGIDVVNFQVTLKDANNRLVPNAQVRLQPNNANLVFSATEGVTDDQGRFTARLTSSRVGQTNVSVWVNGDPFTSRIVTFIGSDPRVEVFGLPQISAGQDLVYALRVTNDGRLTGRNISVTAGLPFGTSTFVSEAHPTDVQFLGRNGFAATWIIPELAVNESRIIRLVARSISNLATGRPLRLSTLVTANDDWNRANSESGYTTTITSVVNQRPTSDVRQAEKVQISLTSPVGAAKQGQTIPLQFKVKNVSSEAIHNVLGFSKFAPGFTKLEFTNWPDPTQPGLLLPNQEATATFNYLVTADFLDVIDGDSLTWVTAVDATPEDGATLVQTYTRLTGVSFDGAYVRLFITPNRPNAGVSEAVQFTVTVENDPRSTDSATALQLREVLGGQLFNLTPAGALGRGQRVTQTLDYTMTGSDVPGVVQKVNLTGRGDVNSEQAINLHASTFVRLNVPVLPGMDLSLNQSGLPAVLIPDRDIPLPLNVTYRGNLTAVDVSVRLLLPAGVTVVDTAGASQVNPERLIWTRGSVNGNFTVTPVIRVSAALGSILPFDVVVSSSTGEENIDNNLLSVSFAVEASAPTHATIQLLPDTRTYIIADGKDRLTAEVLVRDQLYQVIRGTTVTFVPSVPTINLSASQAVTDSDGKASVTFTTTEAGAGSIAAVFSDRGSVVLPLDRRDSAIQLSTRTVNISAGGTVTVPFQIVNTSDINDEYRFEVVVPTGFEAGWITFEQPTLPMRSGAIENVRLTVRIPADLCNAAGSYPVTLRAVSTTVDDPDTGADALLGETLLTVNVSDVPVAVREARPTANGRIGNQNVLFGWRSDTLGTSVAYVRRVGTTRYTSFPLNRSATDPTFSSATRTLPQAEYQWYGTLTNGCGRVVSLGSAQEPLRFDVTQSVTFVERSLNYTLFDDYNQTVTTDGRVMAVTVRNDDVVARQVVVDVDNPYPDLTLGFIGQGSSFQSVRLAPGQILTLTLRVFTQDIQQKNFAMTVSLRADGVTDSIPLALTVERPVPNISYEQVSFDPKTLITVGRLVNNGLTVTDVNLDIVQPQTKIPGNFAVQPDLHHVYLPAGASIEFQIIPLEIPGAIEVSSQSTALMSMSVPDRRRNTAQEVTGQFDAVLTVGQYGNFTDYNVTVTEVATNQCLTGTGYIVELQSPITLDASSGGWYCTNRPNIDIPIRLPVPIPQPISPGPGRDPIYSVESIEVRADFSPSENYSHSTSLAFNNVGIGSYSISGPLSVSAEAPPTAWSYVGQDQIINLTSVHPNDAHYTVATNIGMTVSVMPYICQRCASNLEEALAMCNIDLVSDAPPHLAGGFGGSGGFNTSCLSSDVKRYGLTLYADHSEESEVIIKMQKRGGEKLVPDIQPTGGAKVNFFDRDTRMYWTRMRYIDPNAPTDPPLIGWVRTNRGTRPLAETGSTPATASDKEQYYVVIGNNCPIFPATPTVTPTLTPTP